MNSAGCPRKKTGSGRLPEDPVYSVREIPYGYIGAVGWPSFSISVVDPDGPAACHMPRVDIPPAVADHEASLQIDAMPFRRLEDQSRPRLPARAPVAVVVIAHEAIIQGEAVTYKMVQRFYCGAILPAPRHVGLVGDQDQRKSRALQTGHRLSRAGHESRVLEAARRIRLPLTDDGFEHHAIPVEKHSPAQSRPARASRGHGVLRLCGAYFLEGEAEAYDKSSLWYIYGFFAIAPMKAMLLAAGEGRRLGPLTESCPKPMVEIAGAPILEHNVRLLVRYGIRDLIINLHHQPAAITEHFGDGSRFGARIAYSYEAQLLGTAGAVKNVEAQLTETFVVLYGDNLTTCDLGRLIAFHQQKGGIGTMALFHRENATASGIAEIADSDRIARFLEKPGRGEVFSSWVNAGILVWQPAVLDFIPAASAADFGRDVIPALLAAGRPLYGYKMSEGLWWIDSPDDFERTRRQFLGRTAQL